LADTEALNGYIIDRGGEGVLEDFLQVSNGPAKAQAYILP
jgi:hypothetical protein